MTEEKKSKNPFINMANDAKKKNQDLHPGLGKAPKKQGSVVRRTGRGG